MILDPFLSTLAAPPVSVDVSKDELAQLAAKRRAQGGREGQTVVDEEGEWEKWPEEEVVKWEKVAAKSKAVGERERVDPPVVAQVIADQPRSKSAQRKAVRKAKTVAAAAAAVQAPKYPPGLPRPPSKEPPSSYAELVKPIPELPPQPHQPSKSPTATTTPTPTLSASLKAARLARPSFTSTSVPAPVDAKPSWTRKSPILSKPKELGPSPPPPPTSTSSANPEPSSRPLGVVLATSAFLRKPTPSSPTPDLGAIPRPSLALVEEHEEEVDAVCSLGLGLGAGPLGQLDEDEDEDEGEGALGEDARFEDAEEVEVVEEEGEDEAELESIEEKLKRMGGGVGLGLWSGMGAGGNEEGEEAFEDAEEDEGADVAEAIRPTELVRSSSFAPASRPRHDRKKSVRFEEDRQEGQGQQEQEMSSWTASSPSPEDISSTGAPPHDEAIVKVSIGHTYLPPSPPESPPQHRHPMPLASPMSLAAAPPSSTPITRFPPFLRSAPLANANVSSNDWQQQPATATFNAPVSTPAPRSVGKDVDQWLSSTEDWQKRASQRRTLISILNNGEGVEATPSVAAEPPSAEPSPPRVDVEEGEPPDAPVAAGEGGEDEACDVLAAPVDGAPLRHADTTAPRIEVQVPSPPPTAEQRDSTQQSTSVNGHELYKVEQSAELLPDAPKRIVLANLERIKSYPAELPLSHAWSELEQALYPLV